ncbi:diacylglycerol kinase family protein [Staphylococcus chromogenes]|nr:diacylglycerol kinase family protein [Staphylococcus chromogenes]
MRCLVLSNPNSTSHTQQLLRAVIPPLHAVSEIKAVYTQHPGHAREICRGLRRSDYDAVIAIGGDGTVNEVLEGLLGDDVASRPAPAELPRLGIIPTGSANVFARALGFPNNPGITATMLAELLVADAYRRVPVGRINDRWFCVNAGFGLDAEVIGRMERIRESGGLATPWRYSAVTYGVWNRLRKYTPAIHTFMQLRPPAKNSLATCPS